MPIRPPFISEIKPICGDFCVAHNVHYGMELLVPRFAPPVIGCWYR